MVFDSTAKTRPNNCYKQLSAENHNLKQLAEELTVPKISAIRNE